VAAYAQSGGQKPPRAEFCRLAGTCAARIDEPPSVNRLIGLSWMGHPLYPAVYPEDLRADARDFYRRFYRIELDDEQFEALLQ
jgi:hypothetical protein